MNEKNPGMSRSFVPAALAALSLLLILPLVAQCETVEPTGEASLAWRLDSMSTALLGPDRPSVAFKLGAALLNAAERLVPTEQRFPRLQVLALMQAGDTQGAIEALKRYRNLNPTDPVAQVELVDLYASGQETLDEKLKYLSDTSSNPKLDLPPEVRAQLATEAAKLLAQKSPELAGQMAAKAVKFYPLAEATRMYYLYVARHQQLPERVAGLLAVLKADPAQAGYLSELADLLAQNGLANESLPWYEMVDSVVGQSHRMAPPWYHNLRVDYAAEWAIAGKLQSADMMAGRMLNDQPLDADAWFLKLTVAKAGTEESYNAALDLGRTAFIRRWNRMHGEILSGHASTEPINPPAADEEHTPDKIQPLDPAPVLQKVQQPKNEGMKAAVISVASDIAWFELYFDHKADAAGKWIDILKPLLPADSVTLGRLEGWQALIAGQVSQAHEILSKIAKEDPLSELGLITADQLQKKPVDPERIRKLLDDNRTGLVGAMLWTTFKNDSDRPPARPSTAAVQAELKFPPALLMVLAPGQARRVYSVESEPLQTTYDFGTPVLARVTIQNNSDVDLTVGADALIHNDLWFDAQTLGVSSQIFPGMAFDQLQGAMVLHPHQQVTQNVRLDEGSLRQLLRNSPASDATTVNCDVITNPVPLADPITRQEVALPGPGGSAQNFFRTFTYAGVPLSTTIGQGTLQGWMNSTSAVQKIHAVDLVAAYILQARKPNSDDATKKAAKDLPADLAKLRRDPIPLVSGWATYASANLASTSEEAEKLAGEMASSGQWTTRLLGLLAGGSRPAAQRKQIAARLASDPDPTVKAAASAMMEWIDQMPEQSNPTSQPATAPAKP